MTESVPLSSPSASTEASPPTPDPGAQRGADDDSIRTLIARLARPHSSGGAVIERATILAEGADFAAVLAWITAHGGEPEVLAAAPSRGLHGARLDHGGGSTSQTPLRFVLPAGTLTP